VPFLSLPETETWVVARFLRSFLTKQKAKMLIKMVAAMATIMAIGLLLPSSVTSASSVTVLRSTVKSSREDSLSSGSVVSLGLS